MDTYVYVFLKFTTAQPPKKEWAVLRHCFAKAPFSPHTLKDKLAFNMYPLFGAK